MQCKDFEKWMIEAQEDASDETKMRQIRNHASACSACAETWRLLEVSRLLLEKGPRAPEPGPYFYPRLISQIREVRLEGDATWRLLWSFTRKLAAVSAVVLVLLMAVLFYDLATTSPELPVIVDSDLEPSFPDGPMTNLVLQSGRPRKEQVLEALMSSGGSRRR